MACDAAVAGHPLRAAADALPVAQSQSGHLQRRKLFSSAAGRPYTGSLGDPEPTGMVSPLALTEAVQRMLPPAAGNVAVSVNEACQALWGLRSPYRVGGAADESGYDPRLAFVGFEDTLTVLLAAQRHADMSARIEDIGLERAMKLTRVEFVTVVQLLALDCASEPAAAFEEASGGAGTVAVGALPAWAARRGLRTVPDSVPERHVVVAPGALVRAGESMDSEQVCEKLPQHTVIEVAEWSGRRCRIVSPICGWLSFRTAAGEPIAVSEQEYRRGRHESPGAPGQSSHSLAETQFTAPSAAARLSSRSVAGATAPAPVAAAGVKLSVAPAAHGQKTPSAAGAALSSVAAPAKVWPSHSAQTTAAAAPSAAEAARALPSVGERSSGSAPAAAPAASYAAPPAAPRVAVHADPAPTPPPPALQPPALPPALQPPALQPARLSFSIAEPSTSPARRPRSPRLAWEDAQPEQRFDAQPEQGFDAQRERQFDVQRERQHDYARAVEDTAGVDGDVDASPRAASPAPPPAGRRPLRTIVVGSGRYARPTQSHLAGLRADEGSAGRSRAHGGGGAVRPKSDLPAGVREVKPGPLHDGKAEPLTRAFGRIVHKHPCRSPGMQKPCSRPAITPCPGMQLTLTPQQATARTNATAFRCTVLSIVPQDASWKRAQGVRVRWEPPERGGPPGCGADFPRETVESRDWFLHGANPRICTDGSHGCVLGPGYTVPPPASSYRRAGPGRAKAFSPRTASTSPARRSRTGYLTPLRMPRRPQPRSPASDLTRSAGPLRVGQRVELLGSATFQSGKTLEAGDRATVTALTSKECEVLVDAVRDQGAFVWRVSRQRVAALKTPRLGQRVEVTDCVTFQSGKTLRPGDAGTVIAVSQAGCEVLMDAENGRGALTWRATFDRIAALPTTPHSDDVEDVVSEPSPERAPPIWWATQKRARGGFGSSTPRGAVEYTGGFARPVGLAGGVGMQPRKQGEWGAPGVGAYATPL